MRRHRDTINALRPSPHRPPRGWGILIVGSGEFSSSLTPSWGRAASRGVGRKAHESPGLEVHGELADTDAALPILGDVDLQDAGVVGVGAVELVAVEQQHAVGVTVAPARRLEARRENRPPTGLSVPMGGRLCRALGCRNLRVCGRFEVRRRGLEPPRAMRPTRPSTLRPAIPRVPWLPITPCHRPRRKHGSARCCANLLTELLTGSLTNRTTMSLSVHR